MTRMHGEHRKDYAARQFAKAASSPAPELVPAGVVRIAMLCTCASHPYPHWHSLNERIWAARRWNSHAKNKVDVPKQ